MRLASSSPLNAPLAAFPNQLAELNAATTAIDAAELT